MGGAGLHRWFSIEATSGQGTGGKLQEAAGGCRKLAGESPMSLSSHEGSAIIETKLLS